jgi:2'-5' RNA ligase
MRVARLLRGSASALVVPVPAAEPLVRRWRERHDPAAAAGMPAHVTVLYPFVPARAVDTALENELAAVVGRFAAFDFRLERFGRFPGVLYLAPEPAAPFVELTQEIAGHWPDYQPYEGAFAEIVPHLTIAIGEEPADAERELAPQLPVAASAEEVWLMTKPLRGNWRVRLRLPFAAQ